MLMKFSMLLALSAYLILSFFGPKKKSSVKNMYLLGFSACFSVALLFGWVFSGCPATTASLSWFSSYLGSFRCSLVFDFLSSTFFAVGLAVTWSMMEFSHYYMATDPNSSRFIRILILFLFFMLLLVASKKLFLLFVGWEGVGILSFVLMGWWFTRSDAKSAALQAIMYNRMGDSGIMILLSYTMIFKNTWNLQEIIYSTQPSGIYKWCVMGIIIAAAGKSAQFSLHPWLPSAMEGPTPVSALLHSSTMVVAGIFLLMRTSSMIENHPWGLSLVGLMGALTALFAASAALVQYDFKKVVAYSTTSQLGIMAVAVGLNLPYLAFFHICTHAFFKALLFLCSGSMIHSYKNEQDMRKMGNAAKKVPYTTAAVIIASLALCGLPFLAGFYSKDLILEAGQISLTNSMNTVLALMATLMTAIYSLRVVFFVSHPQPKTPPLTPVSEEKTRLLNALSRLLIGALGAGWALTLSLFSKSPLLLPITLKNLPMLLTVIAFLALATNKLNLNSKAPTKFLGSNWFFVQITHTKLSILTLMSSLKGVLRTLDQGWNIGLPHGTLSMISNLLNLVQKSMSGSMVKYIFASTLLASTVFLTLALFY